MENAVNNTLKQNAADRPGLVSLRSKEEEQRSGSQRRVKGHEGGLFCYFGQKVEEVNPSAQARARKNEVKIL